MKTLLITLILIFSGCTTTYFVNTPERFSIYHDKIILSKELKTIKKSDQIFSPLLLSIEIKEDPNTQTYFAYEDARVNGGYIFDYSEAMLVHKIFKPSYSKQLLRLNNLTLFYLTTKQKSFYMLVNQINKKELQFIYPLSYDHAIKIFTKLDKELLKKIKKHKSFTATSPDDLPLSSWSPATLIIDTIVKKQGGRALGR